MRTLPLFSLVLFSLTACDNNAGIGNAKDVNPESIYYDYTISDAQELKVNSQTIFLVKVNNANAWKTIRLSNGDVEEIESYSSVISPCR